MENMDRRLVLGLGLAASTLALPTAAAAQTYGPTEGKEIGPGVRVVDLGKRDSVIPAYKMVKLRDVVIQPGAKTPDNMMKNDMVCHMTEGELAVVQNGKKFTVKKGGEVILVDLVHGFSTTRIVEKSRATKSR